MPEVLSQKQIDELLGSLLKGDTNLDVIEEQSSTKKVKDYDFRSPKKFTREQLKLLDNIFDNFARLFSMHLSSILRVSCQMEIVEVEEEEYREYNNALNDSVLIGIIGLHNEEFRLDGKQILVEMARPMSFVILDRLLGGDGHGYNIDRDYTDIEVLVMDYVFKQMLSHLKNAWSNYAEIEHKLDMIETNSRLIQFIRPDETVIIIAMEMTIRDMKANINICLTASVLDSIFRMFNSRFARAAQKEDEDVARERREYIMGYLKESPLTVTGILGNAEITLKDLLELQVGDVIPLDSRCKDDSIVVNVEKVPWFLGYMGAKKKKYAVKLSRVYK